MKRVWTTIVLLLLGVGTTYGFAIGIAIWRDVGAADQAKGQFCGSGACMWQVSSSERPGVQQSIGVSPTASFGRSLSNEQIVEMFRLTELRDPPWPLDECCTNYPAGAQAIEKRCGWPFLAVRGGVVTAPSTRSVGHDIVDSRGCFARWNADAAGDGDLIVIPLMPTWPEFMLNVLTFALTWGVVLAVSRAVRPRVRTLSPRAFRILAVTCFALGIGSTMVVALCCALFVDENARDGEIGDVRATSYRGPHYRVWWLSRAQQPGAIRWVSRWIAGGEEIGSVGAITGPTAEANMPRWAGFLQPRAGIDLDRTQVIADARGWPWPAFGGGYEATRADDRVTSPQSIVRSHFGIVLDRRDKSGEVDPYQTRLVPLRPLWPGLLADTMLFTFAWVAAFMLLLGPGALRRSLRTHRGQCLSCGYDLRAIESERCPECGLPREAFTALQSGNPPASRRHTPTP